MKIRKIIINKKYAKFLKDRNLIPQYLKAKKYILDGDFKSVDFKLRQSKNKNIYYFRINKQFRVFGIFENGIFKIKSIDNHQN